MKIGLSILAAAVILSAPPAFAHHSGAMYEPTKVVTLNGTVMTLDWKNPHARVDVIVVNGAGQPEQWGMECSTPNILARKGWSNSSVKTGDKVSITMRPMKDGSKEGFLLSMTTPKGVVLKDHDY